MKIDHFRGEYAFLSNFWEVPVTYKGLTYGSNEAAFQAQKCMTEEEKQLLRDYEGKTIVMGVRPENTEVGTNFQLKVLSNENLGMNTLVHGHIGADGKGERITCKLNGWCNYKANDVVGISITKRHFFDKETTNAIKMEV